MKKLSYLVGALALVLTGVASIGCGFFILDEPTAPKDLV